jgi:hypothetical protein
LSEALPKAEWRARPCNLAHHVLAKLAKEGLVSEVVTTNWDTLIEYGVRRSGVPFTPVINPQLLKEGGLAGGVRIAKIHGCIDHPEDRLLATAAELAEWSAEWARVLFEYVARTRTLVFVGYSGAAASVTVTLASIAAAGETADQSYIVDPRGLESIADTEHGAAFLAALGGENARVLAMSSSEFFAALLADVFPLLLVRPARICDSQVQSLCAETDVEPAEIKAVVDRVVRAWGEMGPDRVQSLLPSVLPGSVQEGLDDPYIAVIPNSEPLAYVWLVWALLEWADAAFFEDDALHATGEVHDGVVFLAIAAGGLRRAVAGIDATSNYAAHSSDVGRAIVAVIFGDIGPMPEPQVANASVARPSAGPSVVRPSGPTCVWISGGELLSTFARELDSNTVKARIIEVLREKASALEDKP